MHPAPGVATIAAFGGDGVPVPVDGGEGLTFRVGGIVAKQVHDESEASWTQQLMSQVRQDGFRLADPVRTVNGDWVHEGWTACRFVEGLRPAAPDWAFIVDAGLRFADAVEQVRAGGGDVLAQRTHRWAIADRAAWGEQHVQLTSAAAEVVDSISHMLAGVSDESHFVHGDLAGNVHIDPAGAAVILDVSPYLRPRLWAAAVVTADAVLWNGADPDMACEFASTPRGADLFGRALVYRLVAEQLADRPRHGALLNPYHRVLSVLR